MCLVGLVGLCPCRKDLSSKNNACLKNDTVLNWGQDGRRTSNRCNNAGIKMLEGSELDERLARFLVSSDSATGTRVLIGPTLFHRHLSQHQ